MERAQQHRSLKSDWRERNLEEKVWSEEELNSIQGRRCIVEPQHRHSHCGRILATSCIGYYKGNRVREGIYTDRLDKDLKIVDEPPYNIWYILYLDKKYGSRIALPVPREPNYLICFLY